MSNRRYLTYEEYEKYLNKLVTKLQFANVEEKVDYIYGIPRGGLPIAVHLSHNLNIPILERNFHLTTKQILVVDDLVDDGETLSRYKKVLDAPIHATATLFYKPHSIIKPDYYIEETTDSIVFPWEDKLLETCSRKGSGYA